MKRDNNIAFFWSRQTTKLERLKVHLHRSKLMAAVAPCAYCGCRCGQPGHMAAFQQSAGIVYSTHAYQDSPVKLRFRRLLLEVQALEQAAGEAEQAAGEADGRP